MSQFDAFRRSFLRTGAASLAAASFPAASLAVAASSPRATAEKLGQQGIFDVRQYGATGDGKTLDTRAIQAAIDAAATAGGGVVLFPAGSYLSFSIHLKSFVHLHLMQGATLIAADSPQPGQSTGYNGGVYDAAEPNTAWNAFQDYGHNHWHNSLIWAEEIHDFSITGTGLIWGRGLSNGRGRKGDGVPFIAEQPGVGNKAIALKNCRNLLLRDFSILKGGHFGILLTGVDNVTIDNLKIDTDRDGMDIDCCQNVRVTNCTVNSPWDDGICPKSSYALGYARPTRNVTISDCFVTGCYQLGTVLDGSFRKYAPEDHIPHTGRIKCGTESNGGFINITIANCIFEGCQGYALESVDGALLEDVTITNTTMRDLVTGPLFLRLGSRLRGPAGKTQVGTLRRILISNLVCHNAPARFGSIFTGIPNASIEDVKLSDIYIEPAGGVSGVIADPPEDENQYPDPNRFGETPSYGFYLRHLRNLEMSHVELAPMLPDSRPAFSLVSVDRADFFGITAPRAQGNVFALNNVTNLRIGWSRAADDIALANVTSRIL
jgi:polygalacturonase